MSYENIAQGKPLYGFVYAMAGTLLTSTNFVTAKYGLKGFNPESFSVVWTSSASMYSLLLVCASGQLKQLVLPARAVSRVMLMGLAVGVGQLLLWAGLALLDPSFQSFLWRFFPFFAIAMGAIFLGERLMAKELVLAGIMVLGGCISTIGRWHIVGMGVILSILACMAASVQVVLAKKEVANVHPNVLAFYRIAIAAVVITFWTFLSGKAHFYAETSHWVITLLGAFLGPFLGWVLIFRSYSHWDLSRSSIVMSINPLFVLPLAYLFLGKFPNMKELLGGLVILAGSFGLAWIHLLTKQPLYRN